MTTVSDNSRAAIRDRIKAAPPYASKTVHVDEWDADVEVRSMALGPRNDMNERLMEQHNGHIPGGALNVGLIVECSYTPDGEKLFDPEDEGWLRSLPASITDKIASAALVINGFTKDEEDDPVENAAKKSDATETAG